MVAVLNRGLEEGLTEKVILDLKEDSEPCVGRILQAEGK